MSKRSHEESCEVTEWTAGGEPSTAQTVDKQGDQDAAQSILEKNRRAQKRFRIRQKARLQGMEEQLMELTITVRTLTAENASLRKQNAQLEGAFRSKEGLPRGHTSCSALNMEDVSLGKVPRSLSCNGALSTLGASSLAEPLEKKPSLASAGTSVDLQAVVNSSSLVPGGTGSMEPLRACPYREGSPDWKALIQRLSGVLLRMDDRSQDLFESMRLMVDVASQVGWMLLEKNMMSQEAMMRLLEGGAWEAPDVEDPLWNSVKAVMDLNVRQTDDTLALYQGLQAKQQQLYHNRQQLRALMNQQRSGEASGATQNMQMLTYRLKANLREEHAVLHDFASAFFKKVLEPLQFARCVIQSFPYYPDAVALGAVLAAHAQRLRTPALPAPAAAPTSAAAFFPGAAAPGPAVIPGAASAAAPVAPALAPGLAADFPDTLPLEAYTDLLKLDGMENFLGNGPEGELPGLLHEELSMCDAAFLLPPTPCWGAPAAGEASSAVSDLSGVSHPGVSSYNGLEAAAVSMQMA